MAAQMQLQRELGLRREESAKFAADRDILRDGRAYISAGTKGGRERMLPAEVVQRPEAQAAIDYTRQVSRELGTKNLLPKNTTERQATGYYYRAARAVGINKAIAGAASHGNRHAWAQTRYEQLTGFVPRCKFAKKESYQAAAQAAAGDKWSQLDRDARLQIKSELGHGPDRDDVVSQYLGSGSS